MPKPSLKTVPTKVLMAWMKKARMNDKGFFLSKMLTGELAIFNNDRIMIWELKDELSGREHVPNNEEAKEIRKKKAKEKKNR